MMSECASAIATPEGREWLLKELHRGPVEVNFTKADGTQRVMNCTLQEGVVVPYERKTEGDSTKVKQEDLLPVWDLDKGAWRSFKLSAVTSVKVNI